MHAHATRTWTCAYLGATPRHTAAVVSWETWKGPPQLHVPVLYHWSRSVDGHVQASWSSLPHVAEAESCHLVPVHNWISSCLRRCGSSLGVAKPRSKSERGTPYSDDGHHNHIDLSGTTSVAMPRRLAVDIHQLFSPGCRARRTCHFVGIVAVRAVDRSAAALLKFCVSCTNSAPCVCVGTRNAVWPYGRSLGGPALSASWRALWVIGINSAGISFGFNVWISLM